MRGHPAPGMPPGAGTPRRSCGCPGLPGGAGADGPADDGMERQVGPSPARMFCAGPTSICQWRKPPGCAANSRSEPLAPLTAPKSLAVGSRYGRESPASAAAYLPPCCTGSRDPMASGAIGGPCDFREEAANAENGVSCQVASSRAGNVPHPTAPGHPAAELRSAGVAQRVAHPPISPRSGTQSRPPPRTGRAQRSRPRKPPVPDRAVIHAKVDASAACAACPPC